MNDAVSPKERLAIASFKPPAICEFKRPVLETLIERAVYFFIGVAAGISLVWIAVRSA